MGHWGFSYMGAIYLILLWIPNLLYQKARPADDAVVEPRWLRGVEMAGQAACTTCALVFSDHNPGPWSPWSLWLLASWALMLLYELCWARYFRGPHTQARLYRPLGCIPVPLATLPVAAFFLLGVYGRVLWLMLSAVILAVGHIGIHLIHARA